MRIEHSFPTDPGRKIENEAGRPVSKPASASVENPSADSSSLSTDARRVAELQAAVKQLPEVRQDKVDLLKQKVDAGTYHPTLDEIVKAVVDELNGVA